MLCPLSRRSLSVATLLLGLLATCQLWMSLPLARAIDLEWDNLTPGLLFYDTSTNWDPVTVPGDADNVLFAADATLTVILGAPSNANNFTVTAGDWTFTGGGGTSLDTEGVVTIDDASQFTGAAATLTGPSNWDNVGNAIVGDAGLGTFTVNSGADFRALNLIIGDDDGSTGVVNVDGVGSLLQTDGTTAANGFFIGNTGTGTLNVTGGGLARIVNDTSGGIADFELGVTADGEGTLNIDGPGSQVIAEDVFIGNVGTGHLSITNGGVLNQNIHTSPDAFVAQQEDSSGDVTVNGDDSQWLMARLEIGNLGDATLSVEAGGLVRSNSNDMALGDAGGSGRVAVFGAGTSNSTLDVTNDLYVGSAGRGELFVGQDLSGTEDGTGSLVVGSNLFIGFNSGNNMDNRVVVSGPSATANIGGVLEVGTEGHGTFEADNGATVTVGSEIHVGFLSESDGTLLVDGTGTTVSADRLFVGNGNGNGSTGDVTVSGGAVATFTGTVGGGADAVTLGDDDEGVGTLTVTGAGSRVETTNNDGGWFIGGSYNEDGGTGTANITNGGEAISAGPLVVGYLENADGTLNIASGGVFKARGSAIFGYYALAKSVLSVDGRDSVFDANDSDDGIADGYDLTVLGRGGGADVDITDGGRLDAETLHIGDRQGTGTNGTIDVRVSGVNNDGSPMPSTVSVRDDLIVGHSRASTNFTIEAGAEVFSGTDGGSHVAIIGRDSISDPADVLVTGAGSKWIHGGDSFFSVGEGSDTTIAPATLTVSNGGAVETPDFILANQPGSVGLVNVTNPGSRIDARQRILVGDQGVGTLSISDGGVVSGDAQVEIGAFGGGVGTVNVLGSGARLEAATFLSVGDEGTGRGTLTVTNGGAVANLGDGFVGRGSGVSVATIGAAVGNAASWTIGDDENSADLYLAGTSTGNGLGGTSTGVTGTLNVNPTGTVTVNGTMRVWDRGIVNLDGGTLELEDLNVTDASTTIPDSPTFNFNAGILRFLGNAALNADRLTPVLGSSSTLVDGQHLAVDGLAAVSAPLRINGGTLSVGSITAASVANLDFDAGTLNLTASDLVVGAGGQFGGTLNVQDDQAVNVTQDATVDAGANLIVAGNFSSGGLTNDGDLVAIDTTVGGPVVNHSNVTVVGTVDFDGLVSGPGDFFGPGTANFNGGMAPGASPGEVAFEGSVSLDPANTLFIEIGGEVLGDDYDSLSIAGDATLDGLLDVSLPGGFDPAPGTQFTVLSAGSVSDNGLTLGGSAASQFEMLINPTTVVLQAIDALPGDFNLDGTVNLADYTVWRDGLGGLYTQADYTTWKNNFGQTSASSQAGLSPTAVPEPAALVLGGLLAGLIAGVVRRRTAS